MLPVIEEEKARAKAHGRSTEAEIRDILKTALRKPDEPGGLGTQIAAFASRSLTAFVAWRRRSASVLLPWSMCAMIEKLRMCCISCQRDAEGCNRSAARTTCTCRPSEQAQPVASL